MTGLLGNAGADGNAGNVGANGNVGADGNAGNVGTTTCGTEKLGTCVFILDICEDNFDFNVVNLEV